MRAPVAALVLFASLLLTASAWAQNITVDNVSRPNGGHEGTRKYHVSRADCESADVFEFPFTVGSTSGIDQIEVWLSEGSSGPDCSLYESRGGTSTATKCTQIPAGTTNIDTMGTIEITAADIANAVPGVTSCVDSYTGDASHQVTLYFLLTTGPGDDVTAENTATYDTEVDLVGPAAPTDVVAKDAEEATRLEFTAEQSETPIRYFVYCDPIPGEENATTSSTTGAGGAGGSGGAGGAGGAGGSGGSGGDGGTGGSGTSSATTSATGTGGSTGSGSAACGNGVLVEGATPPPSRYRCSGDDPVDATDGISVTGLRNGTTYAMAVAAVDDLDNPGVLSAVVCATPQEVDDFFDVYRGAGGTGGGLCSVGPYGVGVGGALGFGAVVLGAGLSLAARRRRRRVGPKTIGLLTIAGLSLALPGMARAQSRIVDNDWRQENRYPDEPANTQFAVEVRFAPYWPAVDSEPGLTGTPYEDTFGTDPNFYFGLEFDYMPLRIPYVGTFGPGFGWGYTWASEKARLTGCTPRDSDACLSEDVTSLTIMPMHLSAVLRADEMMRRTGVPIVPYGKFGFGLAYWSADQTSGQSVSTEQQNGKPVNVSGEDVSWGLHVALGAAFALNWLDASSAGRLRENTGIGHVYLFGEWMNAMLTGLGSGDTMYVGTSTVVAGLAADF